MIATVIATKKVAMKNNTITTIVVTMYSKICTCNSKVSSYVCHYKNDSSFFSNRDTHCNKLSD